MSSSTQKDIPQENVSSSLYVGGLDPTVTDTTLFEIFNIIGPVASTRVCRDAVTRRSLGYAYVNYLNVEDARRAKKQLNSTLIKNCPCRVRWSQRDPSLRKPNTGPGHIIIKNLDEQIDNTALRNVFAGFGNILSCKVATDNTGGLEGYGFVHYEKVDSADAAIKTVNGTFLNNKKVYVGHHVSRKERQSKIKEQNAQFTDLYVKNIHPDVLEEEFMELFQRFGAVTSAVIEVDHEGNSQGFGFVTYVDHEEAQKAVDALHDTELKGKKLFVSRNCKVSSDVFFTNLYVKNVHPEVTQDEFMELFQRFGTITSAVIQVDDEGNSKGFGFVNYEDHEEAQMAVDALHDTKLKGRKLFVSRAQKKAEREEELRWPYAQANMEKSRYEGVNLYIKNLEDDVDDEKLRAEFEPFGAVISCKVMRNEKGTSKGFGFVCFSSPDEATKAVAEMHCKMIGTKPLYVSLAQHREVRKQQLESQIAQRNQIRMQQAAAAGLPGGYVNGPLYGPFYYPPPSTGGFPPQAGRGMMGYGQPGMMPPRPRYLPNNGQGMPIPAPYGQALPQSYGMPGFPRGAAPRPPGGRGGPGSSPTNPNVPMPRANGPAPPNGATLRPGPPPAASSNRPPAGAPAPTARPGQQYKLNPQTRNTGGGVPLAPPSGQPEVPTLTAAALTNASPMEQKQTW